MSEDYVGEARRDLTYGLPPMGFSGLTDVPAVRVEGVAMGADALTRRSEV